MAIHSSGSYILGAIERMSMYAEQSIGGEGKWTVAQVIDQILGPSAVSTFSRIALSSDNPVFINFNFTTVADQKFYQLPINMENVWRVAQYNSDNTVKVEVIPKSQWSPAGEGWRIEDKTIALIPTPATGGQTWTVSYTPSAEFSMLYSGTGKTGTVKTVSSVDGARFDVAFNLAPTYGRIDLRPNAYVGQTLRVLGTTAHEERTIESVVNTGTDLQFTLRRPLSVNTTDDSTHLFEIVPPGTSAMWSAIVAHASMTYAMIAGTSQKKYQQLAIEYTDHIKTAVDNVAHLQARVKDHFDKFTVDNPEYDAFGDMIFHTK